ncbi:hypothetical protein HMPREF1863_01326 [Aedoeadaptatus coxii]|uniref:Uncharacterized protein n=1 Tax=Aedoeadaptatus coxii TaxID=755172 RepID=A0A134ADH3_9FIRM|nr:hypothetical protein HMPREF1863_01326 [Peptoniphilus coxii]
MKESIQIAQKNYDKTIHTKYFYPFISDSSFMKVDDDEEGLSALRKTCRHGELNMSTLQKL